VKHFIDPEDLLYLSSVGERGSNDTGQVTTRDSLGIVIWSADSLLLPMVAKPVHAAWSRVPSAKEALCTGPRGNWHYQE